MSFSLQQYRPNGAKMAFLPMVFIALGIVLQIPRDWAYGLPTEFASVLTAVRVLAFLLTGLIYVGLDFSWGRKHYTILLSLVLAVCLIGGSAVLATRPATQLFDFLLAMTGVAYIYFLLPAPFGLKLVAGGGLSAVCLWSVFFWKAYTPEQAALIALSFLLLNLMGPISAWSTQRLRTRDYHHRQQKDREAQFKGALADLVFDALVIPDAGKVRDFNQAFLDMLDLRAEDVRGEPLSRFLDLPPELTGTGPGTLRSNHLEVAVEVRSHEIVLAGEHLTGYLIRDTSAADNAGTAVAVDLAGRIQALPLSKREKEIVAKIVDGYTRFQIAEELLISDETVKKHTGNIYRKLDLTSKTGLVRLLMN